MLKFEWNALRTGDKVLVHDSDDTLLALIPGVVAMTETTRGAHGVGIRVTDGGGHQVVRWPSYMAAHRDPPDLTEPCWRCAAVG